MVTSIVVNKDIYLKYKDEILPLNARLFTEPYFYKIDEYKVPLDLQGIEKFLDFNEQIDIYATATFIDFVNILLVLSFLKQKNYSGRVCVRYLFIYKETLKNANLVNINLTLKDYDIVDDILSCFIVKRKVDNVSLKLAGYVNFINFYNMLIDNEKFMFCLEEVIDDFEENEEEIAEYLEKKYSNMGLNKEFYLSYLKKYM